MQGRKVITVNGITLHSRERSLSRSPSESYLTVNNGLLHFVRRPYHKI